MRRRVAFIALLFLMVPALMVRLKTDPTYIVVAAQDYPVTGIVLDVDRSRNVFTVSIQAIPGFVPAMAMPFEVRQAKDLDGLVPGAAVEFVLVVDRDASHAERIRIVRYQSVEQDPLAANRLKLLTEIAGGARPRALAL